MKIHEWHSRGNCLAWWLGCDRLSGCKFQLCSSFRFMCNLAGGWWWFKHFFCYPGRRTGQSSQLAAVVPTRDCGRQEWNSEWQSLSLCQIKLINLRKDLRKKPLNPSKRRFSGKYCLKQATNFFTYSVHSQCLWGPGRNWVRPMPSSNMYFVDNKLNKKQNFQARV